MHWSLGRDSALTELVTALVQAGRYQQARQVADNIADSDNPPALRAIATAHAQAGRYDQALLTLGETEMDQYLGVLTEWAPHFERTERGLTLRVLLEATEVAGWVREDWQAIHQLLVEDGLPVKQKTRARKKSGT